MIEMQRQNQLSFHIRRRRKNNQEMSFIMIRYLHCNIFKETFIRKMLVTKSMSSRDKVISWDPGGVVSLRWICCPIGISDKLPTTNISLAAKPFQSTMGTRQEYFEKSMTKILFYTAYKDLFIGRKFPCVFGTSYILVGK